MIATTMVHTVNGPVPCCDNHANKLMRLMQFMGTHCNATLLLTEEECTNCLNEAKKEAK